MIAEAERVQEGLGPNLDSFTRAGVKIPHPEPYSGEVDLERFEVFITGILRWLSPNLLLGSSANSTLVQLKYLGTCLAGDASEWCSCNVEHYMRSTCEWMLQSALIGLQKHFLHPLTHRHVSMQFEAVRQGSRTVQDLLNSLERLAVRMVQYPDGYTMHKRFLAALRKPLCREVLLQGHTAEFSHGAELALAAERIENAMCYDMGTWHPDALNSNTAAQARPIPARVQTSTMVWPYPNQGIRPRDAVGRGPPMNAQAKPFAQRGDAGQPKSSR